MLAKGERMGRYAPAEIFVSRRYGEENFVYLSSYVLASRSSDVSSQFGRLQSDQLQLQARGKTGETRGRRRRGRPSADSGDPKGQAGR